MWQAQGVKGGGVSPPFVFMLYGYIRVSTDKQTLANQRFEILRFVRHHQLGTPIWVEETISGAKEPKTRKLGPLLERLQPGDILVASELSRLGRSLFMVLGILDFCLKRKVQVYTVKDNFHLGDDISSKVLAFAFGLSAEIERNLISQRTKEAMARLKSEGVTFGPPFLLAGREDEVLCALKKFPIPRVAMMFGVSVNTVRRMISRCGTSLSQIRRKKFRKS